MTSELDDWLVQGQRARVLAAARMLLRDDPRAELRLATICARAGVSRRTFYEGFDDRAELALALFDDLVAQICATLAAVRLEHSSSWLDGVRAAMSTLLDLFDASPGVARFLIVGSLAGDDALLEHRARALAALADELERGAPSPAAGSTIAPFGAEALIGAVVAILHARLLEDPVPALGPLLGSLMSVIALPYLGVETSRAELERATPASRGARGGAWTLDAPEIAELPSRMRLTRRTLQVLTLIAERPGIGNSELTALAGIRDAGQTSRLLSRLRRLGLLEHPTATSGGGRKAWQVTPSGSRLLAELDLPPRARGA